MNYNTLKYRLREQMTSYLLYMLETKDSNEINAISDELTRIKSEIETINKMSESRRHEQVKTIDMVIESKIKHLNKSEL